MIQVLREVTAEFMDDGTTPYDINNGLCEEWANDVLDRLRDTDHCVEIWETPFGFADTNHFFVRIDGTFYDAECLEGVEDHMGLPIFHKLTELDKGRQPVWLIDYNRHAEGAETSREWSQELQAEYNKIFST